ncbi:MAG: capsule assembly Wzi family protein [Bacteroidales bacterium]|nr:capsule assembly Wzi family protein [Bacteroidales bacterium]
MKKITLASLLLLSAASLAKGAEPVRFDYSASLSANASTGAYAPYMIGSWNSGRVNGANGIWQDGLIKKDLDLTKRFSWGMGFEYIAGYGSAAPYDRYESATETWTTNHVRQAPFRLLQLYAELKYRSVYLIVGPKERHSRIVDDQLSSGDITRSNNAMPIPGAAAGFLDFQDIPFTNGWVQIDGEIMYGRTFDKDYKQSTFNYYSGLLSLDNWYTYKRCYFRTKPTQPFSIIVGMQAAGMFAGYATHYRFGKITREENRGFHIRDLWDMFFPREGSGESFYKGNSLGSWDFKARYNFKNGSTLAAYFEWPWEDGSGIGRRNGWDGLWGVQYNFPSNKGIGKVLFEYFDFTNQSGPIHWSPTDHPGSDIEGFKATGGDNYYNNDFYGPYSNFGMSIGSPFPVSPVYNKDGMPNFTHNRARGVHAAVSGNILPTLGYVAKFSWQEAGGTGRYPGKEILYDTSAMIGADWKPSVKIPLTLRLKVAFDTGRLRGDNFGAMLTAVYDGSFKLGKK